MFDFFFSIFLPVHVDFTCLLFSIYICSSINNLISCLCELHMGCDPGWVYTGLTSSHCEGCNAELRVLLWDALWDHTVLKAFFFLTWAYCVDLTGYSGMEIIQTRCWVFTAWDWSCLWDWAGLVPAAAHCCLTDSQGMSHAGAHSNRAVYFKY